MTHDGFFAPDSISWKVIGHPIALIGGMRALMVQTLHPLAMAGVDQYSDFHSDPLRRLQRTAAYVSTITFGDRASAEEISARVRRLHSKVKGVDPVTGRRFSATDPETLLWVHLTEVHSFLAGYRAYAGHLTRAERDRYCAEQVVAGELIGIPRDMVPDSVDAYRRYFAHVRPQLCSSVVAAETIEWVHHPTLPADSGLPPIALPAMRVAGAAAAALFPGDLRRMAGLPAPGAREMPLKAAVAASARVLHLLVRTPGTREVIGFAHGRVVGEESVRLVRQAARLRSAA